MPKTLLLADDSVTIQKVVGISFASEDIEITTVDNGDAAVAKARELVPDVILADVVMPGLSGYEVCEAIRAEPSLRHIPVLLLTGTFEAFDEARAAAAGAAGHVSKPFEAQTLVDRVHELLEAAPQPEAAPEAAPGVATPSAAPAETAAPEDPGATTDAFDFFSDDDAPVEASAVADASLDLEEPEGAFAFGDDDFDDAISAEPAPDHTVAIVSETPAATSEPDALDFSFEDSGPDPLDAPMNPSDLGHTTLLDPAAGADLDVSSSDLAVDPDLAAGSAADEAPATPEPVETPQEVARPAAFAEVEAVSATPEEAEAIDVSSSDFEFGSADAVPDALPIAAPEPAGEVSLEAPPLPEPPAVPAPPPIPEPPAAPEPPPVPEPAPVVGLPQDPVMDALSRAATPSGNPVARPFGAQVEAPDPASLEPTPDPEDTMSRGPSVLPVVPMDEAPMTAEAFEAEPMEALPLDDEVASDLPMAEAVSAEAIDLPTSGPEADAVWGAPAPVASDATASDAEAPVSADTLSPAMREELRDTLEKIAWDAFGQVTEKVVREAIEKIERAAWEVVPKLAETLIQEEIRRLKGGNDPS